MEKDRAGKNLLLLDRSQKQMRSRKGTPRLQGAPVNLTAPHDAVPVGVSNPSLKKAVVVISPANPRAPDPLRGQG